ncbi:MAG: SIS domain-containing protein [Propionibacteriaceae bacterium]|nr:SIS domain-containing protein [Propionibacteriaceae bacterium]
MNPLPREAVIRDARSLVDREAATVAAITSLVGDDAFNAVVDRLLALEGKVITSAAGTSGTVARRLAHLLSVCGTTSLYLHPTEGLHGSLGAVGPGDVVIALSKGGGTGELTEFASRAKARQADLVVMTCRDESPLRELADIVVLIPPGESDPGDAIAMGSTLAMEAWGDALATTLMQLRGYTWEQFLFTHPGGRVGEQTEQILDRVQPRD